MYFNTCIEHAPTDLKKQQIPFSSQNKQHKLITSQTKTATVLKKKRRTTFITIPHPTNDFNLAKKTVNFISTPPVFTQYSNE